MSELTPIQDAGDAREFVASLPRMFRRRGEEYYQRGAVLALKCVDPGTVYEAQVRGTFTYDVLLTNDQGEWDASCSCPMQFDCKHVVAAMLALLDRAAPKSAGLPIAARPPAAAVTGHLEPALKLALARDLTAEERKHVKRIRELYVRNRPWPHVGGWDIQQLFAVAAPRDLAALNTWPHTPRTEIEFWQFLAFNLQRQRVAVPEFLLAVVDGEQLGKLFADWQRKQDIEEWRNRLNFPDGLDGAQQPTQQHPLDVRLRLAVHSAQLEWRPAPDAPYQPLKPAKFKQLAADYQSGRLDIVAEASTIWLPFYQRWEAQRWAGCDPSQPDVQRILSALLRAPATHERIVGATGAPMERPAEPLRWQLRENINDYGDYQLTLACADGTPAPAAWLVLRGRPALYVTETAIYRGPAPVPDVAHEKNHATTTVPKPMLESRDGIGLLTRLGVALPAALEQRVRRVPLHVKIFCDLKPTYPGANTESVSVRVVADGGAREERYTVAGWSSTEQLYPVKRSQAGDDADTLPFYDRAALEAVPALLAPLALKWDNYEQTWYLRLTKTFAEKFVGWLATLPPHIEVLLDKNLATLRRDPVAATVKLDCKPAGVDWFDLNVTLDVAKTELSPDELNALLNARGGYVRLGNKGWRRLQFNLTDDDDERLSRLGLSARDFSAEPQRLHALQLADDAAAKFLPEAQVAEIRRRVGELKTRVAPPLPANVTAQLRPYQVEGFHFLAYLSANSFGGILADDMGLGKTLQALTWLSWLRSESDNATRPTLVVCPKSVMDNWRAEAERFLPGLRVQLWRGTAATALPAALTAADVLVLNYAQLRLLADALAGVDWLAAILDEGQYIKNPESKTARAARALQADHRLVLTGTPIENRLLDLWSLLAFAMPGALGNRAQFATRFDQADDPLARRRLSARVRPFLLRRTKGQVAKDLPDRVEEDLLCELEGEQLTLYRAEFKHAQQMLLQVKTRQDFDRQRFNFLTSLLRLRQICCHPALVNEKLTAAPSAKLDALFDVLEPLMDEGHKVLVFSQFVTMLDLLRPLITARGWPHFYLTGSTENRGALVANFQNANGAAVFLVSLKAGGFGLNLTAASYVVLFDPWWNPAVETQAIDRTHRIGQTRKVIAYRLLIKNSIEEKIRALQRTKRSLAEDVLGEENFSQALTLDDLRFLFAGDTP